MSIKSIIQMTSCNKLDLGHRYPACPWVCHFRGERLERVPKTAWRNACEQAVLNGKLFHDLRQTAVRNMVRAGISERVAIAISEYKTRSVFDRYNIVSEIDVIQAKERIILLRSEEFAIFNISTDDLIHRANYGN